MITKKIMVVVEHHQPSDTAINHAVELAQHLSADLFLLGIMSAGDTFGGNEFVDPVLWSVARSEFEANINATAERLRQNNLSTEVKILKTPLIEELCCRSDGMDCQLIVVQTDHENPSPRIQAILKHTPVPVLLVRSSSAERKIKNILVPLDGSQRAESCLNLAASIVRAGHCQLHLVSVIQRTELPSHTTFTTNDMAMEQQLIDRSRQETSRYLEQVGLRLGVETVNHVLVDNRVTFSLHQLIAQEQIDLLILNAHGHSGEAKWSFGTIAENLIRYAEVPTMVVQDLPAEISQPPLETMRVHSGAY